MTTVLLFLTILASVTTLYGAVIVGFNFAALVKTGGQNKRFAKAVLVGLLMIFVSVAWLVAWALGAP